jgi:hypothetical protein
MDVGLQPGTISVDLRRSVRQARSVKQSRLELAVVPVGERPAQFIDPTHRGSGSAEDDDAGITGGRELLVAIDGVLELRRWGGLGMEPDTLLNPEMPLLPAGPGQSADVLIQRCDCGEVGCGSLSVTISRDGDAVGWSNFRHGDEPVDLGPFVFDAAEYESELRRAHDDRSWESRSERIARLVTDQLRPEHGGRPLSFEWATSWSPTTVEVSYFEYRHNPEAGQTAQLDGPNGQIEWYSVEPDEQFDQYIGSFPIKETSSDEDAVSEIVHLVHATHPQTWPRSDTTDW